MDTVINVVSHWHELSEVMQKGGVLRIGSGWKKEGCWRIAHENQDMIVNNDGDACQICIKMPGRASWITIN